MKIFYSNKIIYVTTVFLYLTFSVSAQKKTNAKNNSINNDKHHIETFDLNMSKVPTNFRGNNIISLYKNLKRKSEAYVKNEFETSQQFETRKKLEETKPILGNLNQESLFVLKPTKLNLNLSKFSYDADNRNIELEIRFEDFEDFEDSEMNTNLGIKNIELLSNTINENKYKGTNAYGVTKNVTSKESNKYYLSISNWKSFANTSDVIGNKINFQFNIDAKLAKQIKENDLYGHPGILSALYIGNISKPLIFEDVYYSGKPTLSQSYEFTEDRHYINYFLKEIWIYNNSTGEIYLKIKPSDEIIYESHIT